MLVYDNGKVCVLANTRCGHTAMAEYFGVWGIDTGHDWVNTAAQRILVLRHPYDRLHSALCVMKFAPENVDSDEWLKIHSSPYLQNISEDIDFRIIDFYKLRNYIPLSYNTRLTYSNHTPLERLPELSVEMQEEYERYCYFKHNREEISPEEWRELTI